MVGPVVLQLLKTLTNVRTLVYEMRADGGTGSTKTAENIDHCPYSSVLNGGRWWNRLYYNCRKH